MNQNEHDYNEYVRRLEEIRRLSTPSLDGIPDADGYSERLRENFLRIGRLAGENRAFLDSVLMPLLRSERELTHVEVEGLTDLGECLLSAAAVENIDLPVMSMITQKLLQDAVGHDDLREAIQRLDARMDTCYALMSMLGRVKAYPRIADRFRREGIAIGERLMGYLDRDRFEALDAASRQIVLTDARYMAVFYEGLSPDSPDKLREPELLDRMLEVAEDPFYRRLAPDFDWGYFRYRALNYYSKCTDLDNARRFGPDALSRICDRTEAFAALWYSDPERYGKYDSEKQVRMVLQRNRYLAGRSSLRAYRDELTRLYRQRDPALYNLNGVCENLELPAEAICTLDPASLTPEQGERLTRLYRDMLLYAFHMPNSGSLSSMLEYYISIVNRFIEVPGGISFEDMMLKCLAALHPPTYIHSVMVAKLARCLCDHLIDRAPERLAGTLGCATGEEVARNRDRLLDFIYHASLCHDFGKLTIIDTIFVYGRNLFDMEFDVIRTHPRTGYRMLSRYDSTRPYADIALGHHRWYDNSRGYPEDFDTSTSPVKPIIDVVLVADCLDAATDSVGRSYRRGKSVDAFLEELRAGAGTQYAPWIAELLEDEAVSGDLRRMLLEGREETYRDAYRLLRSMHDAMN